MGHREESYMKYYLAEATKNTFVLFDCLHVSGNLENIYCEARSCLEKENRDDALILTDGEQIGDSFYAKMVVVGLDGNLAEFCGNGARACAAYLYQRYPCWKKFFLKTKFGKHALKKYMNGNYSIKLPKAGFEPNEKFVKFYDRLSKDYGFRYVDMLEPHILIQEKMSAEQLLLLGREMNKRTDFFPFGININAWHVMEKDILHVQTYERGVQRLTQSCGTGSASCAAFYKPKGKVRVVTQGGTLDVHLLPEGIELRGQALFA